MKKSFLTTVALLLLAFTWTFASMRPEGGDRSSVNGLGERAVADSILSRNTLSFTLAGTQYETIPDNGRLIEHFASIRQAQEWKVVVLAPLKSGGVLRFEATVPEKSARTLEGNEDIDDGGHLRMTVYDRYPFRVREIYESANASWNITQHESADLLNTEISGSMKGLKSGKTVQLQDLQLVAGL